MNLEIRWKGTRGSGELFHYIVRRAAFALGRFTAALRRIRILFEDLNGPKGGVDKRCLVTVTGSFGTRVVEARDVSFHAAADRALGVVSRSVVRASNRLKRRRGPWKDDWAAAEEA